MTKKMSPVQQFVVMSHNRVRFADSAEWKPPLCASNIDVRDESVGKSPKCTSAEGKKCLLTRNNGLQVIRVESAVYKSRMEIQCFFPLMLVKAIS